MYKRHPHCGGGHSAMASIWHDSPGNTWGLPAFEGRAYLCGIGFCRTPWNVHQAFSGMNLKLLLDANLSWRLVARLKSEFPEITHTIYNGFEVYARDVDIWAFAQKNSYSIITNDEDFYLLAVNRGFPPKIVLLRMGNQSTRYVAEILIKHKTEIAEFMEHEEYGVLEIF